MKRLTIVFTLLSNITFAQIFANDTTMSGTYNAGGKVMNMQAKISGSVIITNAVIEGNPYIQVFDTTVTFGANVKCREFSAMWFGANPSNADNSRQLQIAIEDCITNGFDLFLPAGNYKTSQPLIVGIKSGSTYLQSTLNFYGESTFWSDKSKITYSGDSCALGLQLNKGSRIHNLTIIGKWVSPTGNDTTYFNIPFANYTNQATSGNGYGIWVDPVGNWSQRSGSTGCQIYDMNITGFQTLVRIGNDISQNDEIIRLTNIQLGNGKVGIQPSQSQEKGNTINGVYSWGSLHTLFNVPLGKQAGNYFISNGNIAGRCIRIINWNQGSFFPSYFSNIYAENIGSLGTITTTGLPVSFSNCIFDFAYKETIGTQTLVTTNSNKIKFNSCSFRYYGNNDNLTFSGNASYDNCNFSGTVTGGTGSIYTTYGNGTVTFTGAQVYQQIIIDTIPQPASIKMTLRSNR